MDFISATVIGGPEGPGSVHATGAKNFADGRLGALGQTRQRIFGDVDEFHAARLLERLDRCLLLFATIVLDDRQEQLGSFERVDTRERTHGR